MRGVAAASRAAAFLTCYAEDLTSNFIYAKVQSVSLSDLHPRSAPPLSEVFFVFLFNR